MLPGKRQRNKTEAESENTNQAPSRASQATASHVRADIWSPQKFSCAGFLFLFEGTIAKMQQNPDCFERFFFLMVFTSFMSYARVVRQHGRRLRVQSVPFASLSGATY